MAKKQFGEYYLGLDIGTDSVGWAVTDSEYRILTLNHKYMWGSRLFPEAKTAADRRAIRIARRRIQRRNQRLALLQDIFCNEVCKIDPDFFLRLQEGMLHIEDKSRKNKNNLFASIDYDDKTYHQQYPTIYHLRSELIHSRQPHDVRLVYLALHHIIKYRGHFLFEGIDNPNSSLSDIIRKFLVEVSESLETPFECSDIDEMVKTLCDRHLSNSDKQKKLFSLFNCKPNTQEGALLKLLTGATVKLKDIFIYPGESEEEIKIEFGSDNYDEKQHIIEALLGEDYYIIEKARAIYNWTMLESILHGNSFFSDTKVKIYEQHGNDLKLLKKVIKKYIPGEYNRIFKDPGCANNYCAYVGVAKINGKKAIIQRRCTQFEFGKFIISLLKDIKANDKDLQSIRDRITMETFMPKLRTKDNSIIPNQIHMRELEAILANASVYLPFLTEKDMDGLTPIEKVRQIVSFRIPYYVGPLNANDPNAKNTWVVRRSNDKIYPWNFEEIVDKELSATSFITRMTAKCTYLFDQPVLPRNSILYSRFVVLNELNNLRICGEPISVELKQKIFRDCFMTQKKVTVAFLLKYLESNEIYVRKDDITGIYDEFRSSFGIWKDMHVVLGDSFSEDIAEKIIRLNTVLGDDRKMLRQVLSREFGKLLDTKTIMAASNMRCKGWGRISRKLLTDIYDNQHVLASGEHPNIINYLWETNESIMQLLGEKYGFADAISKYNRRDEQQGFVYNTVKDLYLSPGIKRSVWQTLSIVKEIRKITGHDPQKVFIEVVGKSKNKKIETRKNKLLALYRAYKDDTRDWIDEIKSRDNAEYWNDRLFLYYTQMGRCMYTGDTIDLDKITNQNEYDIDHIFPKSKIKDDSLDNRVLVKRVANAEKTDKYPIDKATRDKMHSFWSVLLKMGFISQKKYERLVRDTMLTEDELYDFISRQLVETRKGTKAVAEILQRLMPCTDIIYVKSELVSDFRYDYDMLKCREVNDFHHGKDAYLNIVVGNVFNTIFTKRPINFANKYKYNNYDLTHIYDFEIKRDSYVAWTPGEEGSISIVRKMMSLNNVIVTRMQFDQKGRLFEVNLVKKGEWQLPMKQNPSFYNKKDKYGGYNKIAGAYFMLVEHTEKGERQRSIIDMPIYMVGIDLKSEEVYRLLTEEKKLQDPQIIIPHIRNASVIEIDGFRMYLSARAGNNLVYAPGHQLIIGYENEKYLREVIKISNLVAGNINYSRNDEIKKLSNGLVNADANIALYDLLVEKMMNTIYHVRLSSQADKLKKVRDKFVNMTVMQQCLVLKQVINLFACNRSTANLTMLGLGGQTGVISTKRTISAYKSAKLITQSITGIFEKECNLLCN